MQIIKLITCGCIHCCAGIILGGRGGGGLGRGVLLRCEQEVIHQKTVEVAVTVVICKMVSFQLFFKTVRYYVLVVE